MANNIRFIKGDLIELFKQKEFDLIAHQCNCVGVMDTGLAKVLAQEFPIIDLEVVGIRTSVNLFGTYECFGTDYGYIINMYSQFSTGKCHENGIDSFEVRLGALENCLNNINKYNKNKHLGLPLIASGLAKKKECADWDDSTYFKSFIYPSVKKCLKDMKVTIVYL